ncbi:MAG: hypothetical protein RIS76_1933 [Verrucomicrobiota bacterium]
MNPNGFGLMCAGAGLVGFYFSYRLGLGIQRMPRVILAVAAMLWALPGSSFRPIIFTFSQSKPGISRFARFAELS